MDSLQLGESRKRQFFSHEFRVVGKLRWFAVPQNGKSIITSHQCIALQFFTLLFHLREMLLEGSKLCVGAHGFPVRSGFMLETLRFGFRCKVSFQSPVYGAVTDRQSPTDRIKRVRAFVLCRRPPCYFFGDLFVLFSELRCIWDKSL